MTAEAGRLRSRSGRRHRAARLLSALALSVLVAGLATAPAFGAVERSAHDAACPAPLHAKLLQLGLAHALASPSTASIEAPRQEAPLALIATPRRPAAEQSSLVRARAPPPPTNV